MAHPSAKHFVVPISLVIALTSVAVALRGKGRLPDTPEDAVRAFFAAAEQGDASAYIALLSGPLNRSFRETQSQLGVAAFRDSLRNSVKGLKGFAISRSDDATEDRAAIEVELVFADRNERQRFDLARDARGWSIAAIGQAVIENSLQPYGTPVYDIAPASDPNPEPSTAKPPETIR